MQLKAPSSIVLSLGDGHSFGQDYGGREKKLDWDTTIRRTLFLVKLLDRWDFHLIPQT